MIDSLICETWPLKLPDFRHTFFTDRPSWERGRLSHAADHVMSGMTVIDVGAEHGDFTSLYRSWVGPAGSVIPIEPAKAYWPCIKEIWEANFPDPPKGWFVGFAGDEDRYDRDRSCGPGWPPASEGPVVADPGFLHLVSGDVGVDQVRLDSLVRLLQLEPDVLMIDVEGAELQVLSGASDILDQRSLIVYVSVHEGTMSEWYGTSLTELHALMGGHGYKGSQLPHFGEAEYFWVYMR